MRFLPVCHIRVVRQLSRHRARIVRIEDERPRGHIELHQHFAVLAIVPKDNIQPVAVVTERNRGGQRALHRCRFTQVLKTYVENTQL